MQLELLSNHKELRLQSLCSEIIMKMPCVDNYQILKHIARGDKREIFDEQKKKKKKRKSLMNNFLSCYISNVHKGTKHDE